MTTCSDRNLFLNYEFWFWFELMYIEMYLSHCQKNVK